jgi:NO-binding membrane sensor protein with MHYT domain
MRIWATKFIGMLTFYSKKIQMGDCLLLVLVATHEWMAKNMVNKFMKKTTTISTADATNNS